MRRLIISIFFLILSWGFLHTPSLYAEPFAILIGPGEFADKQIKPRPSASEDVQALYDFFSDPKYLGIPKNNLFLLISQKDEKRNAQTATKENILKAFHQVIEKAKKDDPVFIVMVAQGGATGDHTCVFCTDSTFKDRAKNALLASDLEGDFKKLKSEKLCVLLDLHLKGFEAKDERIIEPNVLDYVFAFLGKKEKEKDEESFPPGRAILLANAGAVPTVTVGKLSIFTKAVLDALGGKADREGYEPDGVVTVDELTKYLEKEIPNLARDNGKTNEAKQQLPYFGAARAAHFVLTKNPEVTPIVDKHLSSWDKIIKVNKLDKKVSEEGNKLLARMPKLKALQQLRKDLESLVDGQIDLKVFLDKRSKILDSMKLDPEDATSYAVISLRGLSQVQKSYIKELNLGEMVSKGLKGLFLKADETIPDSIKEKMQMAKSLTREELKKLLETARLALGKREDLDKNADSESTIAGGMSGLDPYTNYIDKESLERTNGMVSGSFNGIGVQIRRELVKDALLVVTPIKGSPAYKAGIKAGDLIRTIIRPVDPEGTPLNPPEVISTKGMRTDDAVKLILGKPGTEVKLELEREGVKDLMPFTLKRGPVTVETVLGYKRNSDDSWDYYLDKTNKIGYIHLTQFARRSFIDMEKVVKQLQQEGLRGLVLDLRFNPGGYLDVAENICDLYIDDGVIVTFKDRNGQTRETRGHDKPSYLDFPMVCLINGGSASGSELLSACLQDHYRAIILGERSFGKGVVQSIQEFKPTGGEIKLTTTSFWRPNGKNLNKADTAGKDDEDWGVRPTPGFGLKLSKVENEELFEHLRDTEIIPNRNAPVKKKKEFTDKQLKMAIDYLNNQIKVAIKPNPKKNSSDEED